MASEHPLDRPAWSALTTRQAHLADGDARALRFRTGYGAFVGAADPSPECLAAVSALVHAGGQLGMVETSPWPAVPGVAAEPLQVSQMVWVRTPAGEAAPFDIVDLGRADDADMLALAQLTRPGPFFERTPEMGDFVGVKEAGQLIAMAGERMKVPGFTEISAVCTRPEHRGRGLAGALMRVLIGRIVARGETPFLHVFPDNTGAVALYETLGFQRRCDITFTLLTRG